MKGGRETRGRLDGKSLLRAGREVVEEVRKQTEDVRRWNSDP